MSRGAEAALFLCSEDIAVLRSSKMGAWLGTFGAVKAVAPAPLRPCLKNAARDPFAVAAGVSPAGEAGILPASGDRMPPRLAGRRPPAIIFKDPLKENTLFKDRPEPIQECLARGVRSAEFIPLAQSREFSGGMNSALLLESALRTGGGP